MDKHGYRYSKNSLANLITCSRELIIIAEEALINSPEDISIIEGHRTVDVQRKLYAQGRTKPGKIVTWTRRGKHNEFPSDAFDACPYPCNWDDTESFMRMGELFIGTAKRLGIALKQGVMINDRLVDLGHFELVKD